MQSVTVPTNGVTTTNLINEVLPSMTSHTIPLLTNLESFDFSSYTLDQLQKIAEELEKKNDYLQLENSIYESYYNRSNIGPTSTPSNNSPTKPGINNLKAGEEEGKGLITSHNDTTNQLSGITSRILPNDVSINPLRSTSYPVNNQVNSITGNNLSKRKKGDKSKQVVDVLVQLTPEQKVEIVIRELEELRDELEHRRAEWSRLLDNQRAEMEELDISIAELKKDQYEFRRDIVQGALNERTGKVMAEKVLRYWEDKMRARDTALEKIRLKNATLKTHKNKLLLQLKQKEEMGEVLHAIDFDQLKIENHQYLTKIDERNNELLKLKQLAGNIVQVMNLNKRKLITLEEESLRLQTELNTRQELLQRLLLESDKVNNEIMKALKINNALMSANKEFSVPSVMEYVKLKAQQEEMYIKVKSWRRKVEIAQINEQRLRMKLGSPKSVIDHSSLPNSNRNSPDISHDEYVMSSTIKPSIIHKIEGTKPSLLEKARNNSLKVRPSLTVSTV